MVWGNSVRFEQPFRRSSSRKCSFQMVLGSIRSSVQPLKDKVLSLLRHSTDEGTSVIAVSFKNKNSKFLETSGNFFKSEQPDNSRYWRDFKSTLPGRLSS
uniref:Uncharacterized protein n=1 Tax=Rhizophora mucronata TaxID=61149 RepID=A0A2P2QZI6_RHIMU